MLKFLLICLVIFLFFRVFGRFFLMLGLRWLAGKVARDLQKAESRMYSQNTNPRPDFQSVKKNQKDNNDGEYIDFEEVK